MAITIFHGNDIKLLRKEIDVFETKLKQSIPDLPVYSPENPEIEQILNKISSGSLFGTKELVKIFEFDKINGIEKIMNYPNNFYEIILVSFKEKIPAKITKKLKADIKAYNLPKNYQIKKIIEQKLKNKISPDIIEYLSKNITSLVDIDELEEKMKEENINYLTFEKLYEIKGDTEARIFLIIDDIIYKKKVAAIIGINEFLDAGGYTGQILNLLFSQISKLHQIKKLKNEGRSLKQIQEIITGHPFVIKKLTELTESYSIKELEYLVYNIPQVDMKIRMNAPVFSKIFLEKLILEMR